MLTEEMKTLFVGWAGNLPRDQTAGRPWFESVDPAKLYPVNIYHAQRAKRFGSESTAP